MKKLLLIPLTLLLTLTLSNLTTQANVYNIGLIDPTDLYYGWQAPTDGTGPGAIEDTPRFIWSSEPDGYYLSIYIVDTNFDVSNSIYLGTSMYLSISFSYFDDIYTHPSFDSINFYSIEYQDLYIWDKYDIAEDPSENWGYTYLTHTGTITLPGGYQREVEGAYNWHIFVKFKITDVTASDYYRGFDDGFEAGEESGYISGENDGYIEGYRYYRDNIAPALIDRSYRDGYNKAVEDIDAEGAWQLGYNEGANNSFQANLDKWIVPAVITVMFVGGFFTIARKKRDEL